MVLCALSYLIGFWVNNTQVGSNLTPIATAVGSAIATPVLADPVVTKGQVLAPSAPPAELVQNMNPVAGAAREVYDTPMESARVPHANTV
eukprot:COSAG02_NODE_4184_length_5655_cov_2.189885_5_plen_90_part_00